MASSPRSGNVCLTLYVLWDKERFVHGDILTGNVCFLLSRDACDSQKTAIVTRFAAGLETTTLVQGQKSPSHALGARSTLRKERTKSRGLTIYRSLDKMVKSYQEERKLSTLLDAFRGLRVAAITKEDPLWLKSDVNLGAEWPRQSSLLAGDVWVSPFV